MATLLDYRRRIRSVKNTQQITRAMKFVAASKLRRAQEGVFAARPYAREILRVLRSAMARIESPSHPLMERRPEENLLALLLTGDKGLCGPFNTNVLRQAAKFIREHGGQHIRWIAVGRRGRDALRKRGAEIAAEYLNVSLKVEYRHAKEIGALVAELYSTGQVDAVYTIYNEFKSVLVQRLQTEKLLPIDPETFAPVKAEMAEAISAAQAGALPTTPAVALGISLVNYIYEQPATQIFKDLVPRYLDAMIFRVLLESSAAEHGARMAAMDSATNNAAELIDGLTLEMNKIRQASITREIIEVVSGASSTAG